MYKSYILFVRREVIFINTKNITLTRKQAEILLAAVILSRSISFVMTKIGLLELGRFTILGFRFLLAFMILLPIGWKRLRDVNRKTIFRGMLLGISYFLICVSETSGLKTTDASVASFLLNTSIVLVPLFEAIICKRLPSIHVIISTAICLSGVALLTLKNGSFSLTRGELFILLAAAFYASYIILTDRLSKKGNPLVLGILQVGFVGIYGILCAFIFEAPKIPISSSTYIALIGLVFLCTFFGFTLQPLPQSFTTSERAGLFCALSPVGATIAGIILLNEKLYFTSIIGMVLILFGMVFSNIYIRILLKLKSTDE